MTGKYFVYRYGELVNLFKPRLRCQNLTQSKITDRSTRGKSLDFFPFDDNSSSLGRVLGVFAFYSDSAPLFKYLMSVISGNEASHHGK